MHERLFVAINLHTRVVSFTTEKENGWAVEENKYANTFLHLLSDFDLNARSPLVKMSSHVYKAVFDSIT